ncbi:hypothetical protein D3C72_2141120 [compost metagenome]
MGQACFIDDAFAAFEVQLSSLGQFNPARGAVQQPQADFLLKPTDTARQGRVRHAQRLRRFAETADLDDFDKQRHVIEKLHAHCSISGSVISI